MNWRLALQGSCFQIRFKYNGHRHHFPNDLLTHLFLREHPSLVVWYLFHRANDTIWTREAAYLGAVSPSYPNGLSKVSSPFQELSSCFPFFLSAWLSSFKLCSLYPVEQAANLQVLWSCCSALKKKKKKEKQNKTPKKKKTHSVAICKLPLLEGISHQVLWKPLLQGLEIDEEKMEDGKKERDREKEAWERERKERGRRESKKRGERRGGYRPPPAPNLNPAFRNKASFIMNARQVFSTEDSLPSWRWLDIFF